MTFKNRALQVIFLLFISLQIIGQAKKSEELEKPVELTKPSFSSLYNTWALGIGGTNLIVHGEMRSLGTDTHGNFYNFGGYIYADKMFNPVLGVELKFNYTKIGGASQYFSDGYEIKYLDANLYKDQTLVLDGYRYGFETNAIINLTNLWKLNSKRWSFNFMAGMGYHRYTSKLIVSSTLEVPDGTNFETNPLRDNGDHASSIYLNTSLGLKYRINKRFDIELRPTINLNNGDHFDATISDKQNYETFFTTNLGLVYKFGSKDKYAIWISQDDVDANENAKLIDTDKDGVADLFDKEPETPADAEVYGSGKAVDTDKDGVPDHLDKCILIAGLEANNGCPEDKDGDGIFDFEDVCPEIKGTKENLGCPGKGGTPDDISNRIFLLSKSIYFKTNSDILIGDSFSILNEIASIMMQYPNTKFQIDGHTDDRAAASYNLNLSKRRATSVQNYLTSKGVANDRLFAQGFGEEKPTHSNKTEEGRKFNRRVEINFIQPKSTKGTQIYANDIDVIKSIEIIQPQVAGFGDDQDGDGVADVFDKEPNTPKGALVYGNGVSVDTDKDGIPDYMDDCPLMYGNANKKGCPENATQLTNNNNSEGISITDSDGDGVIDALDAEKDTPYGSKVYGNGVSVDTDKDGVIDLFDKCPLIPGIKAKEGCPEKMPAAGTASLIANTFNDADGDGVVDELDAEPNTPKGAKVYGNGVAIDTDNDGVIDLLDKCPLRPGIGKADGCPVTPPISQNSNITMDDSDGDGVIDSLDQEPNTPPSASVYGNGVSVDTDRDGVPDHSDACPLKFGSKDKEGCPVSEDTDGDGVINIYDKEPNTPFGVKVYGNGVAVDTDNDGTPDHKDACPLQPGEAAKGGCPEITNSTSVTSTNAAPSNAQLIDSDGDGVIDLFDKDPNTPAGALVYGNGIPIDSDRDGLPDYKDECPLKAGPVENKGCPTKDVKELDWEDSDGDGVINQFDKEPNTPKNARVYGNGVAIDSDYDNVPDYMDDCPFKAGTAENKGCPKETTISTVNSTDTDKDGVLDQYDKEPNTPIGAKVYSNGVAIDSDKDGVPDYKDRCPLIKGLETNEGCPLVQDLDADGVPDTEDLCPSVKGSAANKGCPEKDFDKSVSDKVQSLAKSIVFERTKNTLTIETTNTIDEIVKILKEYPATKYQIASHTDNKYNPKYSLFLSKRRANAIMKYMTDSGIQEDRLTSEGYGDTLPKFPNNGDLSLSEQNNRVEFNLVLPN
jgi:outer membrane protein OmpA-like peptidoglycan-associated protein